MPRPLKSAVMQEQPLMNRFFVGTRHSLLAIQKHKEISAFFKAKGDDRFAYLKFGSTPAMQARCLIDSSGNFYEFRPNGLVRGWASIVAPLHDITLQKNLLKRFNNLKSKEISQLLKKNITDLDMHFSTTITRGTQ
jgi:hypothetical protein